MYDNEENNVLISGAKLANTESVYHAAFPAYRVFVFYHEVTSDVVEVRTDQTGGSAERTAGSASITLLNQFSKYILTTPDIVRVGQELAKINDRANELALSKSEEIKGQYGQLYEYINSLAASGNVEGLRMYLTVSGLNPDDFLVPIGPYGSNVEIVDREFMLAAIMEAGQAAINSGKNYFQPLYDESSDTTKNDILRKKMASKTKIVYDKDTSSTQYQPEVVFNYPFQKGDCIFHPNDPVRIAFRDPFDARVWYWKFSGFVDTWTENVGSNKESTITLNCTDVTKMARYTYTQLNTNMLDQMIKPDGTIDTNSKEANLLFFKELFAGLEIREILEILFFGVESVEKQIDNATKVFIAGLTDDQRMAYLLQNFEALKDDVDLQNSIFSTEDVHDIYLQAAVREAAQKIKKLELSSRIPSLKGLGVISHPSGIKFRRKSDKWGVHVYFYGEPDEYDKEIGEGIKDLKTWNEMIHHRVRKSDLDVMSMDGKGLDRYDNLWEWDMEKIITIIGTNERDMYPVGCGRVFFLTSATLRKKLGHDAVDRSFGGPSSMHSEFVDDLTYLYDLAENVEYCFYATPKGDVVFEMPFYDFDPEDFVEQKDITDYSFDTSEMINEYDSIFRQAYSGIYSQAELMNLTNMVFKITAAGTNFQVNDYSKTPTFDYLQQFTIENHEQYSSTNSCSDVGVCTLARSSPFLVKSVSAINTMDRKFAMITIPNLFPLLGVRCLSGGMLGFIDDYKVAQTYLGIQLNRVNSEARNLSVSTIPKFGLMVNRPIKWRERTYNANISRLADSIVWGSSCDTTISMNQIRGWTGEIDSETGRPIIKHFGGDRPFDLAKLLKGDDTDKK